MKCENCGKDEVNFQFTSNINGNITEKNLCAECAGQLGYTNIEKNMSEMSFEDIFTELFGGRPSRRMMGGYGMVFPTFVIPTIGLFVTEESSGQQEQPAAQERRAQPEPQPAYVPADGKPEIDQEMSRRREINILRAQMQTAAEEENFEKAAALRDSIRRLENGGDK